MLCRDFTMDDKTTKDFFLSMSLRAAKETSFGKKV